MIVEISTKQTKTDVEDVKERSYNTMNSSKGDTIKASLSYNIGKTVGVVLLWIGMVSTISDRSIFQKSWFNVTSTTWLIEQTWIRNMRLCLFQTKLNERWKMCHSASISIILCIFCCYYKNLWSALFLQFLFAVWTNRNKIAEDVKVLMICASSVSVCFQRHDFFFNEIKNLWGCCSVWKMAVLIHQQGLH